MSAILRADDDVVGELQKARPELYALATDFFLLLTVPNAFEFREQSEKWRRAIRLLSQLWHVGLALDLKYAPHSALSKLFSKE